ncbi:MAG: LPS-assembly protein LptD [Alphaproteobacteria bacterium]|nr:LPS-assembly protein LptD [Alphaproteobacteria bacterium]
MFRGLRQSLLGAGAAACLALYAYGVQSQTRVTGGAGEVLLQADTLTFDRDQDLVLATGHVELTQGGYTLRAETLTYNQRSDVITASGNVVLMQPTGEVVFAEQVELTDDMKEGFIRGFSTLLKDDARLAAAGARRLAGTRTELDRAVFSPCALCAGDPTRAPLWQIKAAKIVHDSETHDLTYTDAWIEFFGVPVLYTPYLSHPDPSVERRSGILTPSLVLAGDLGTVVRTPVYWAIAPDRDFTFRPIWTTEAGQVLGGEYRQRLANGNFSLRASGAFDEHQSPQGRSETQAHIDTDLLLNLTDTWRAGGNLFLTTNDTYLERFDISAEDTLISRAYAEGFWRRSYALAETYYFQGLRAEDDQGHIPFVLPKLNFNYVSEPIWRSGRTSLDANALMLTRNDGTNTGRMSLHGGWRQPFAGVLGGDRLTFSATLRLDAYNVQDGAVPPQDVAQNGTFLRALPQLALDWSYPFIRRGATFSILLEPVAQFVLAPNGGNPSEIPNEDSINLDFDDTSLWNGNRFPGDDRVEGGARVDYGLRAAWYGDSGARATGFLGQSYRFNDDATFPANSGLEGHMSDLVGRLDLSPNKYFDALYRFRIAQEDWSVRRHELAFRAGPRAFHLGIDYNFLAGSGEFADRQEIGGKLTSKLTDTWSFSGHARSDLSDDGRMISMGGAIEYQDECFDIILGFNRRFTRDRDIPPSDSIMLRVNLKYLGDSAKRGV